MPPLFGNGEWWRGIPPSEIGPVRSHNFGTLEIASPVRFQAGTQAMISPGHPAPPIHKYAQAARSVASMEAAANQGDRSALGPQGVGGPRAAAGTARIDDPTFNGTRSYAGTLTPEGIATVRAGLQIARGIPGIGTLASLASLGLSVFGVAQQIQTPSIAAPDVPLGDIPVGYDFMDPAYGVSSAVPSSTETTTLDVAQPTSSFDPVQTVENIVSPEIGISLQGATDLSTGTATSTDLSGTTDAAGTSGASQVSGDGSAGTDQSGGSPGDSGVDHSGGDRSGGGGDTSGRDTAGDRSGSSGGERGQSGGF